MKTYGGGTSALYGGEPCHFYPGQRASRHPWIGGWVGPTAGRDKAHSTEKILALTENRTLTFRPVALPTEMSLIYLYGRP
jgi:hypothetical protein